ncbi:MAG: hypothetical protein K8S27_09395 [Candidatus Omnitrophica bacterium]|nr:hypothetical protein [Candidatus Omnitrophota bacterium]
MNMKTKIIAAMLLITIMGCAQAPEGQEGVRVKAERIPGRQEYYEVFFSGDKEIARQRFAFSERKGQFNPMMLSTTGRVPDGTVRADYPSGALMATMTYQNDLKDGLYTVYYENGVIKGETFYVKGEIQGVMKKYYSSGALRLETHVEGRNKGYYENGSLKYEMDASKDVFNLYDEKGGLYPRDKALDSDFMKDFLGQ